MRSSTASSTSAGGMPPATSVRSSSMSAANSATALALRVAMPPTSSQRRSASENGTRSREAKASRQASARSPIPRRGVLRMRRRLTVSVGFDEHPQVGERVAHLLALVEAHPADDLVGQADADEHLLEDARLGVGAVEDRDVAGLDAVVVAELVDLAGDERRLVVLVVGDVADDRLAVARVGPQPLVLARPGSWR